MPRVPFGDADVSDDVTMQDADVGQASAADVAHGNRTAYLEVGKTIQTNDKKSNDPDYVFDIVVNSNSSVLASSLSNSFIKLYNPSNGDFFGELKGHRRTISDIIFGDPNEPHFLFSSSTDGTLRAWDVRSQAQVAIFSSTEAREELWSVSLGGSSGQYLAGGGNEKILLWDRRSARQMACFEDAHTEAVTRVRFCPSQSGRLLSASVDGLICSFDTSTDLTEEEAMEWVMSVGTSISRIGFYGPNMSNLWCTTSIETLSLWDLEKVEQIADFPETRSMLSLTERSGGQVDYLIGCSRTPDGENLCLFAGNNSGTIGSFPLFPPSLDKSQPPSSSPSSVLKGTIKRPSVILGGGHSSIVRAVIPVSEMGSEKWGSENWGFWTGGEDGNLCAWKSRSVKGNKGRGGGKGAEVGEGDAEGKSSRKVLSGGSWKVLGGKRQRD